MKATVMHDKFDVRIENVPDSSIQQPDGVPDGYREINERKALKVLVRP